MGTVKLGVRQLFGMQRESLEKRVLAYFEQEKNAADLVEFAVAILVRNALCDGVTFAYMFKELIRELFLTAKPNDALRRYSPYFESYFSTDEWKRIIKRLYKNKNYRALTKEARLYKDYLEKEATLDLKEEDHIYCVASFFEDANGKRHKLTIRNTDPNKDEEMINNTLRILTTLSIFSKEGVRQFAEFINYVGFGKVITTSYDTRHKEQEEPVQAPSDKKQNVTKSKKQTEKEASALMKAGQPQEQTKPSGVKEQPALNLKVNPPIGSSPPKAANITKKVKTASESDPKMPATTRTHVDKPKEESLQIPEDGKEKAGLWTFAKKMIWK